MRFNRKMAVAYARRWALSTNPKYPRFKNDCTSFVSQAMLAGGWKMTGDQNFLHRANNDAWWYGGSMLTRASYTWGGAQNFYKFLTLSGRGSQVTDSKLLHEGDVVQIKRSGGHVYHSMVVTATAKTKGDVLLSYHTSDHLDEPLGAVASRLPTGHKFVFWRISDIKVG